MASAPVIRPSREIGTKLKILSSRPVKRKRRKTVIQNHHVSYDPEVKVRIWKNEHWAITIMNRRKNTSKGFIEVLKQWIREREGQAVEL